MCFPSRSSLWLLWAVTLLAAGAPGCGSDPNSEIVEFCIPLEESDVNLPVARVVLDYDRFSADDRPTQADAARFLVASESAMTVVDFSHLDVAPANATDPVTEQRVRIGVADALSDPGGACGLLGRS